MTRRIAFIALAALAAIGLYLITTAPAMWWMSAAEKAELIAQAEKTHGPEAAQYLRAITR